MTKKKTKTVKKVATVKKKHPSLKKKAPSIKRKAPKKDKAQEVKEAIDLVFPPRPEEAQDKKQPKPAPKERLLVDMKKPFDVFCALTVLEKIISDRKDGLAKAFKQDAWEMFYGMLKKGEKPDSFLGRFQDKGHAEATALFTLKIKQGEISECLAEDLKKNGIPFKEIVLVPEKGYRLNPDLFGADQETLGKIAQAIQGIEGIDPSDIFLPCDPISNSFMSEDTLSAVMAVKNEKLKLRLLSKITTRQVADAKLGTEDWNTDKAKEAAIAILKDAGVL
jgi:hypothetical protein